MSERADYDAVVVGAGPNGLAAAITIAAAGRSVLLIEGASTVGGSARTAELTLPGFRHDVCSAVHPLAIASPFLRTLPLAAHGLQWVEPTIPMAHPLDGGGAAVLHHSVLDTAAGLGVDGPRYRRTVEPLVRVWEPLLDALMAPMTRPPAHPIALAKFGIRALPPATLLARRFKAEPARALLAGLAAHAILPLRHPLTSGIGLLLGVAAHVGGWPLARGGSQSLVDAMAGHLRVLGGEIETGRPVATLAELPPARAVLLDVTPRQFVALAGDRLRTSTRLRLRRFKYGPGVFKVDYALDGPVPWAAEACQLAGTVHLGGTFAEVAAAEADVARGRVPERPLVLTSQASVADPDRAPAGKHTLWAYCHVPNGCDVDLSDTIDRQIERFAPDFRDRIIGRSSMTAADYEAYNPNIVGGDIAGGSHRGLRSVLRPGISLSPYTTALPDVYLCSSSTPPGGGVHGMCGHLAAEAALRRSLS